MTSLTADAIKELQGALALRSSPISLPDGGIGIVTPKDYQVHKVPPLDTPLTHVKQRVTLHDRDSFVGYIDAYNRPISRIFAEPGFLAEQGKARLVAVLDYHDSGKAIQENIADTSAPIPSRNAHVATYMPRYSEAWERWNKACKEALSQMEFCELIEECRVDITTPSAANLLDAVRTFKASKKVNFDSLTYQNDGSVKLHYDEAVEKHGASVLLPEKMTLGIPVYYRGDAYAIDVFVRFRVVTGGVAFSLKIDRPDRYEDEAFTGLAKSVAESTGVELHFGRI